MTTRPDTPEEPIGYIRGGGAILDSRRATRVVVSFVILILATLVVLLTVEAVREYSRVSRLQQYGVPVEAMVTSCRGMASGTGITASAYTCSATFTLDGHRYNDVIRGTTDLHQAGETLPAVTDPDNPAILFTAHAMGTAHPSWKAFITPATTLLLLLLLVAFVSSLRFTRSAPAGARRRRRVVRVVPPDVRSGRARVRP